MADFSVTSVGTKLLLAKLQEAGAVVRRAAFDAITVGCGRVRSEARKYCLRSPTQAQLNRLRKTTRKVHRKPSSHSRPKPGGLERSIDFEADESPSSDAPASRSGVADLRVRILCGSSYRKWRVCPSPSHILFDFIKLYED